MPTHAETRRLPYTADQMFDLIADIGSYPEFLPWCSAARIRDRREQPDGAVVIEADLVISFKVYRERFGSRVTLSPDRREIRVAYLDGPFRFLDNRWRFTAIGDTACELDFYVDFEFRSRTLQAVVGAVFYRAMQQIVRAFEQRAAALYGAGAGPTDARAAAGRG